MHPDPSTPSPLMLKCPCREMWSFCIKCISLKCKSLSLPRVLLPYWQSLGRNQLETLSHRWHLVQKEPAEAGARAEAPLVGGGAKGGVLAMSPL